MRKLLLLLAVTLVGLTSCEERLDRLDEINLQQNIQIDILRTDLNALTQSVNDEIARVEQIIAAVDAENDAALIEGLSAAQAELSAAVALLAQADTDNLVAALAAVSAAEETLAMVIANNLAATTAALEALGAFDADLLSRIETVLSDIAALDAALSAEDVRLDEAIALANTLINDANDAIATNEEAIAANAQAIADVKSALASATADLQGKIDAIDFTDAQELADAVQTALDKAKEYADDNDSDTVFDATSLIESIEAIEKYIADYEGQWSQQTIDTTLDAAAITKEIADAIAGIQGFDDSAIQDALTSLQSKLDELVGDVAELSDVAKQQIALMELDGFTKVEGEVRTWSKWTSKGTRVVYVDTDGLLFPSVVLFGETYSLNGSRPTFAGVLDAFLKFNQEKYDDIKAEHDAAQAEAEAASEAASNAGTSAEYAIPVASGYKHDLSGYSGIALQGGVEAQWGYDEGAGTFAHSHGFSEADITNNNIVLNNGGSNDLLMRVRVTGSDYSVYTWYLVSGN